MARKRTIEDDTPIMPDVIAEGTVEKVERTYKIRLGRAYVDRLVKRQATLYATSAPWRRKMNAAGNRGRDTLYAFMLHWLAADMKQHGVASDVVDNVARAAWYGEPLRGLAGVAQRARRGVAGHCTRGRLPTACRRR